MALAKKKDDAHYTYADYCRWDDGERWELIDGVAWMMAPAPSAFHQILAFQIAYHAERALAGSPCTVVLAPIDLRLPKPGEAADEIDTVVQPDLLVVCDPKKLDKKGVVGAPDWIVEVLSPATASRDQIEKRRIYERAGVPEYWIVHPVDRILTLYRMCEGRFGAPDIRELAGKTPVAALGGIEIDWEAILARLPALED